MICDVACLCVHLDMCLMFSEKVSEGSYCPPIGLEEKEDDELDFHHFQVCHSNNVYEQS